MNLFASDIEEAIAAGDNDEASVKRFTSKQKADYIDKYVIRGLDDSDFLAILKNANSM